MNGPTLQNLTDSQTTLRDLAKFNEILLQLDLVNKVAVWNLAYLAIAVGIVLASGALTYFFGVKPTQEKVDRQEEKIGELSDELEKQISSIETKFTALVVTQNEQLSTTLKETREEVRELKKEVSEKLKETEAMTLEFIKKTQNELEKMKHTHQLSLLSRIWKEHYWWEGRGVESNALSSLIDYADTALDWGTEPMYDLWLERVADILKKLKNHQFRENDKAKLNKDLLRILEVFSPSEKKDTVKSLIEELLR